NQARATAIGELTARARKPSSEATVELLATLRSAGPGDACHKVVEILNRDVAVESVWDGLFLTAGELLMRQPGIVGVHCVTSVNALHHAFRASGNDETRRLLMLQAAAFLALFRKFMTGRGQLADLHLLRLGEERPPAAD